MPKLKILAPVILIVLLLVVLFSQRSDLRRLEQKVEALSSSTRVAAQDGQERLDRVHVSGSSTDSRLAKRVASLEQTVARLFGLLVGKKRPAAADSSPATGAKVDNLREDVDALLTGVALDTAKGRKQLHEIVKKVQQEQREQRRQRRRAMRNEMVKARLKKLGEEAGLSGNQLQRLSTALDQERSQSRSIMRAARRGEKPMSQAIGEARALRSATDDKVKQYLDDGQYQAYEKMRKERSGRRWRR